MRRVPVLALLLFGCVKNGAEGMVVLANTAPTGTTCSFTGDPTQPSLSSGLISATSTDAYLLTPLIESRFTPAGSGQDVDRSILLNGANVTLTATTNGKTTELPSSSFSTPVSGTIPAGGTLNVSFPIIPVEDLQALDTGSAQTEVVATVTVFGTEGGGNLNAEPFTYGVTVCPKDAPCVTVDVGACATLTATVQTGNPCNPFQDGMLTCCDGSAANGSAELICPAAMQ